MEPKKLQPQPAPLELEEMALKWQLQKKPSKVVASFSYISELTDQHIKHFRGATYIWKPMQGSIWSGMLMDDNIPYIHMVLATTEVVEYCINLGAKKEVKIETPNIENAKEITATYTTPLATTSSYCFTASWTPTSLSVSYIPPYNTPYVFPKKPTDEELEENGFEKCEQCGETAWDGRICHVCGLKHI